MKSDEHESIVLPKMLTSLLDQHSDAYFIKGLDSRFIYANLSAVKKMGLQSLNDLLYKNENDLSSRLTENKDIIKEWQWQDRQVASSRKKLDTLEVNPEAVNSPYMVRKFPFYNENNKCQGVVIYYKALEDFSYTQLLGGNSTGSFLLTKPDDFFTEKECEVIYLSLQGQTPKSIASRLVCSVRDVECSFQEIYNKACVKHYDDFYEFCYRRGYHRYLPRCFISSRFIMF
ncbi:transcriptional regulator [Candidatus Symbiopectobacterium sp. 'North America']|uniref:LuxR C-terminal-related transcriptional regulator n=1 Tax=Candidatus Symbiopectobacterium sp. 'North America' TaxID=2794574 RepID=UPI0018C91773|nr:LuxR C-terminal-related transcriptional regulator [Candidatus Symbiopectobacterium sp. 'North America']MBG6244320.1 transcriptional regulator [Candidatus Symbiopectobacterium sp. 'North America']